MVQSQEPVVNGQQFCRALPWTERYYPHKGDSWNEKTDFFSHMVMSW